MSYLKEHDDHVAKFGGWSADYLRFIGYLGEISISACDRCPYLDVRCMHKNNSWNLERTILTCNLCGEDVT